MLCQRGYLWSQCRVGMAALLCALESPAHVQSIDGPRKLLPLRLWPRALLKL